MIRHAIIKIQFGKNMKQKTGKKEYIIFRFLLYHLEIIKRISSFTYITEDILVCLMQSLNRYYTLEIYLQLYVYIFYQPNKENSTHLKDHSN